ncbi:hypothetical protein NDU88_004837 [Pleurodeles waltl]|uniref:Uncharacterized protein n=1 Tax=Pleurodeles waltl TaxID=8319 RepID=A0AAV7SJX6_PLEWA|nr:hypothetical protein NDU88_004837 [Pleurodeles waltl]
MSEGPAMMTFAIDQLLMVSSARISQGKDLEQTHQLRGTLQLLRGARYWRPMGPNDGSEEDTRYFHRKENAAISTVTCNVIDVVSRNSFLMLHWSVHCGS